MIKLNRGPEPDFFKSDEIKKAYKDLDDAYKKSERQERFRFDTTLLYKIKQDLETFCNGKCAFCESKLGISGEGQIENFRPKAGARGFNTEEYAPMHYWWLAYEWENLLMACEICSRKYKRDFFPLENESFRAQIRAKGKELEKEKALLVDPCLDNPNEHLEFGENGYVMELTKKGKVTIEILGLNRSELVERRSTEVTHLRDKLESFRFTTDFTNQFTKDCLDYIKELFSETPKQDYAAVQRVVFDNWYEHYSSIWENAKKLHKDQTQTLKKEKTQNPSFEAIKEIKEVDTKLTNIKRFSIKSVKIENFRSIEDLKLNVQPVNEKDEKESWLLLLGDNGIGKSSILQAIALALSSKKQLAKLNLDVTDFLRRNTENGKVEIFSYEHDKPITLSFDKHGFNTTLEEAPTFILGYGSTRLLPKGNIKPDNEKEPYQNVKNLFDYSISLSDPNKWLSNIDDTEFKERVGPAFFDILALKGEDKLWMKDGKINIQQFGEDTELEDNSDGYKTITALVSDIMQTLSIDKANYHNSQGIVLVDEIGNHLHPRWRIKIASALRKAFPKLQFIVTTHEPLCLRGLSYGEVVVMVRDEKHMIRALDKELLPDHSLMRIEQLLTSDLFGLINVMDDEAEKTYDEYYKLLSKKEEDKTVDDKNKITELSNKLSTKEMLGNTVHEQIYYQVIQESIADLQKDGFKAKETLKKETVNRVKDILSKRKID